MSRDTRSVVLACLLAAGMPVASAQQASIGITATEGAGSYGSLRDRRINFVCPAVTSPHAQVWGTDLYDIQSAICPAAVHAGVLPPGRAGIVSIVIGYSHDAFMGSTRNGIASLGDPNANYAYRFSTSTEPAAIDWNTNALNIPEGFHQSITVICPGNQKSDAVVWGTDTYITDSSICRTAVHAGVVTAEGGAVTVTKVPGIAEYPASTRFGVTSLPWGAWPDAFRLSAGIAGPVDESGASGRTIRTAGFTGAGTGADIVPRTISLTGFTGQGSAADIARRTITTPGWTASGTDQ